MSISLAWRSKAGWALFSTAQKLEIQGRAKLIAAYDGKNYVSQLWLLLYAYYEMKQTMVSGSSMSTDPWQMSSEVPLSELKEVVRCVQRLQSPSSSVATADAPPSIPSWSSELLTALKALVFDATDVLKGSSLYRESDANNVYFRADTTEEYHILDSPSQSRRNFYASVLSARWTLGLPPTYAFAYAIHTAPLALMPKKS